MTGGPLLISGVLWLKGKDGGRDDVYELKGKGEGNKWAVFSFKKWTCIGALRKGWGLILKEWIEVDVLVS